MIWISIGIELIVIGLALPGYFEEKKKAREEERGAQKGKIGKKVQPGAAQMVGSFLASIVSISKRRREKNQIYQTVCKLSGDEEGERIFQEYRRKRWGLILGVVFLVNTIWLMQQLQPKEADSALEMRQIRPEYGQGSKSQQVTVILEGEERAEGTLSLRIPEKEISDLKAKQQIQEGLAYIKDVLEGKRISGDLVLPVEWQEVSFYYESLSPDLLSSNGKWAGEIKESSYSIQMKVTAVLAGESETEILTFSTITLAELSAEERLAMVVEDVTEGEYLTENELILPDITELGEKLTWVKTKESKEVIWILMGGIALLFVLWRQDQEYKQQLKDRDRKTRQSYPEFMNELVILVGAGLSLTAAWHRIGQDYYKKKKEGGEFDPLYEEIYRESREMEAGTTMREVLEEFAGHLRFKEARRFAVLLTQNLKRGDAFLISRLKELNQEAWELRKKQVREKTEEADTKLLMPLMLMLVVILIIVLSPAMISMQV